MTPEQIKLVQLPKEPPQDPIKFLNLIGLKIDVCPPDAVVNLSMCRNEFMHILWYISEYYRIKEAIKDIDTILVDRHEMIQEVRDLKESL